LAWQAGIPGGLAVQPTVLGQNVTGDQNEAGLVLFDHVHQIAPLSDAPLQVTSDDESGRYGLY
jgi:hypothetical protein